MGFQSIRRQCQVPGSRTKTGPRAGQGPGQVLGKVRVHGMARAVSGLVLLLVQGYRTGAESGLRWQSQGMVRAKTGPVQDRARSRKRDFQK